MARHIAPDIGGVLDLFKIENGVLVEGALDTAHFSFLHMPAPAATKNDSMTAAADERRIAWLRNDPLPQFKIIAHDVGSAIGGSRRADQDQLYWRITQFAALAFDHAVGHAR